MSAEPFALDPSTHSAPTAVMPGAWRLTLGAAKLQLLPDRAAWLEEDRALLVADVHLGKAETFRRLGVPVPEGVGRATLDRLSSLIEATAARSLLILGDLLHGPVAQQPGVVDALGRWRARHPAVEIALVRGNHDDRAGDPPSECRIAVLDEPVLRAGCRLVHAPPSQDASDPAIAGHLHPVFRLRGRVDRLRLACWWQQGNRLVLPAFGGFTGGHPIAPRTGDRVFVTDGLQVHPVLPTPFAERAGE